MRIRPLPLVITVALVSACAAGQATTPASPSKVSPSTLHPAPSQHPQAACYGPPGSRATIQAVPDRPQHSPGVLQPGTPVPTADIGPRAATSGLIFGLADHDSRFVLGTYPAISTDSGQHWRIDGPRFYYPAAEGAIHITSIDAPAPKFAYVWGTGGVTVFVTADAGRTWQVAVFAYGVKSVSWSHGQLNAQAFGNQLPDGTFPTCLYVSPDHGQTWIFRQELGTVPRF